MAEYLLRNSLNPNKVISCSITFRQIINKGEDGEPVWLLEVATKEPNKDGSGPIPPEYVHYTNKKNIDDAIKKATENIAKKVDWSPIYLDNRPPFVSSSEPQQGVTSIFSNVVVKLKDVLPSAGIDLSSIKIIVNGVDVTSESNITGDPYEYDIVWIPPKRVFDYYNGENQN